MSVYSQAKGSPILKAVIAVLFGILIYVLYEPYQIREQEETNKRESRARLMNIRSAQLMYITDYGKYAPSIDSLVLYVKAKIAAGTVPQDTFRPLTLSPFDADSLLRTPGSQRPYYVTSVDTTVIKKYVVEDPDGYGSIGSLTDDSRVNKASWEE
jgi:type II secretory pathway pseudopilin PulG